MATQQARDRAPEPSVCRTRIQGISAHTTDGEDHDCNTWQPKSATGKDLGLDDPGSKRIHLWLVPGNHEALQRCSLRTRGAIDHPCRSQRAPILRLLASPNAAVSSSLSSPTRIRHKSQSSCHPSTRGRFFLYHQVRGQGC